MPIDLPASLAAFGRGLELLPRIIIAPLLLGGPTLLWLLYRFLVRPGTVRQPHGVPDLMVWVCDACASLTPIGQSVCYRCRAERPSTVIELMSVGDLRETAPIVAPPLRDPHAGVPVGPGRPAPARPAPSLIVPAAPPPSREGPVISPPSRVRVSARTGTQATFGVTQSPSGEWPGTSSAPVSTARRRSGQD
jgi:hypothetical protein